ncbi:MAG TPA: galactokinase [Pseudothermotoga sp.]|nr:galactokinase [Pseudothermotoga sp.]HOK84555.1 galactokinase [Pseudothermotoga sp.]HPP69437.1 galactokinase [Pseudothermotoga sp.]
MPRFRAPGRVNIIGEHTDYNDGFVLPFAIDKHVEVEITPSSEYKFTSQMMNETVVLKKFQRLGKWTDYIMGVIWAIEEHGYKTEPVQITVTSTLPVGAGLSSSAALEIATAYGISQIFDLKIDKMELVEIGVKAEREFVGVRCGVMDQFTAVFAKKDHAIFLDTSNLSYDYVPLNLNNFEVALIDSNTKHELSSSEYNKRREECETILEKLNKKSFRDVNYEDLTKLEAVLKRRARHVLDENKRVLLAVKALKNSEIFFLGTLLYESHVSLRDLYEVSCDETDFIVGFLKGEIGIVGARMVGGGFGGSVLVIAKSGCIEEVFGELEKSYYAKFGKKPTLIRIKSSDGVHTVIE